MPPPCALLPARRLAHAAASHASAAAAARRRATAAAPRLAPARALCVRAAAFPAASAPSLPPAPLPGWARFTPGAAAAPTNEADVLVILVGWLGCRREYLDHYEALYAKRGFSTLALLPPVSAALAPRRADAATASFLGAQPGALLLQQNQRQLRQQRTLLHVASNGGFLFLSQLLRAAAPPPGAAVPRHVTDAARALTASTRGLLLDCAPAVITPDVVARALAALARRGAARAAPPAAPARAAAAAYLALPPVARRRRELHAAWGGCDDADEDAQHAAGDTASSSSLTHAPPALAVPTACLYSADDVLVPPCDVERWAAARAAAGAPPPTLRVFHDAPHVELLRRYPEEYDAAVGEWLVRALADVA
jgi:hypothetical protein